MTPTTAGLPLRTSLIFTLEPVFAALFAWTLGAEPLVPLRALGGFLMVLAMVVSEVEYVWIPILTGAARKTDEKDSNSKKAIPPQSGGRG